MRRCVGAVFHVVKGFCTALSEMGFANSDERHRPDY